MSALDLVQLEEVFDFLGRERTRHILLITEDHQRRACKLLLKQQLLEFVSARFESELVSGVDDPNQAISLLKIIAPIGADGSLTAHVPKVELKAIMLHCLDLEAKCGRNLRGIFPEELLENSGFACVIESKDQQSELALFLLGFLYHF